MKVAVVVTAAGSSVRMGNATKKEFLPCEDGTVLSAACNAFARFFAPPDTDALDCAAGTFPERSHRFVSLVVTCPEGLEKETEQALKASPSFLANMKECGLSPVVTVGGATRQESVHKALLATKGLFPDGTGQPDIVLIHDGARPFLSPEVIDGVLTFTETYGCAVPGIAVTDTLAVVSNDNRIVKYLDRSQTLRLQTPQGFSFEKLLHAHEQLKKDGRTGLTDDTSVWSEFYGPVKICPGDAANRKITFSSDIPLLGASL